ncbi:Ctr copper transporter family-domain-containing protein [Halteromyces radiatus]|uniref:Ctr copper transporter family-domain-containing protein n=1 Tax=Halteromyces radiatus TaxID=101107 RepID=UPI00221EDA1C|nr:Ctr copper transporter family-domain-containing protein [Halteromyces radiatus]KAI8082712.1 Ctr copper transporter family-domain-containing protein [Halteromyces radiatus]
MDHSTMDHSSHGSGSMSDMGGMNMDMSSMTMGTFHWSSTGDALWFDAWMPKSEPAYIGACIGLFVFAVVSRGLLALEVYFVSWRARRFESIHQANHISMSQTQLKDQTSTSSQSLTNKDYPTELGLPLVPPFSWITDPIRSFLTTFSSFVSYLLMLVVMTGNGGFFIVVIVGIFVGEIAFGRFRSIGGMKGGEHDH